jgi:hypothetical protein
VKSGAGWDRDWGWDMDTNTAARCPVSLISSKAQLQLHNCTQHSALSSQHTVRWTPVGAISERKACMIPDGVRAIRYHRDLSGEIVPVLRFYSISP